ncbi:amidase family protein [Myceligenerans xiligouense]|nr:amidase family protein [Myceligenerans xiligouense]
MDSSVWRVLGDDGAALVAPTGSGVLDGETVAVKDLFAVAGQRVGAGNPAWLARAPVEPVHAPAVAHLLEAGAAVTGIARTEEFAWSLTGANAHYGTPPNPAAPGRISGGSTSGPATAVAGGEVSIGLGTDTSGSIRVPAAYQGLWGFRPTHGAISGEGVLPLAPSFDTVGWLTRDPDLLARVGAVLLPAAGESPVGGSLTPVAALLDLAEPDVRSAVDNWLAASEASAAPASGTPWGDRDVPPFTGLPDAWVEAVRVVQAAEAWEIHAEWIGRHLEDLGPAVRGRFEFARSLTPDQVVEARGIAAEARSAIRGLFGDDVLVVPAASSVAPPAGDPGAAEAVRAATVALCATAVLGGLPALAVPLRTAAGLPAAACLIGPPNSDHTLLSLRPRS